MMKRKISGSIVLILCIGITLTGCKNGTAGNTTETEQQENTNVTDEENREEDVDKSGETDEKSLPTGFTTEYKIVDFKDGYFIINMDDSIYSLLDANGNKIKQSFAMSFLQSEFAETVSDTAIMIDYSGNNILPLGKGSYSNLSNWGSRSEYCLQEKDGVQYIIGLDGTVVKELTGTYGGIISNAFLVDGTVNDVTGYIHAEGDLYSLDEEPIDTEHDYFDTCYDLNDYYICGFSLTDLYNSRGELILSFPGYSDLDEEWYRSLESIGIGNLLRIEYYLPNHGAGSTHYYKLVNPDEQTVSEQYYHQIVKADDDTIYAEAVDTDTIDVYDENGDYINSLRFDSSFFAMGEENSLIAVSEGGPSGSIRFLNAEGEEVTELTKEECVNVAPLENCWVLQNDSGEYALMDETGEIRIPYGRLDGSSDSTSGNIIWTDIEIESYNGEEIEDIYTDDDLFCIVTEDDNMSNVYIF